MSVRIVTRKCITSYPDIDLPLSTPSGEWFTQEGEFVEDVFEQRLVAALQRAWGSEDGAITEDKDDGEAAE